jgi:predicted RNase H-like HicB family nuclease
MKSNYTAAIQRDGPWWIGWVLEVPGVSSQATTREELIENLRSALTEALKMNRADALAAIHGDYEEVDLQG